MLKDIISIKATEISSPPAWALMERQLIHLMEKAVELAAQKYGRLDGTPYNVNDVDDTYEAHSYKGLLYAIGADERVLEIGLQEWNAITRLYDDGLCTGAMIHNIQNFGYNSIMNTTT